MPPTAVRFTEEEAVAIRSHVKAIFGERIEKSLDSEEKVRKAQQDNGTFDVIISTEAVDRAGEIVRQNGWDVANYKNNAIVLWGHDYYALPIGATLETYETTFRGLPALGARGVFLSAEINPMAQQVRKLYEFGLKTGTNVGCTTSVGFIPKDFDANDHSVITKAELLEFSFVDVPANQGVGPADGRKLTFEDARTLGLDTVLLRAKGIQFVEKAIKEAQAGDSCDLADGTPGILTTDPKDPNGPLVCLPQDQDKGIKETSMKNAKTFNKAITDEHERHVVAVKAALDDFKTKAAAAIEDQPDMNDDDEGKKKAAKEAADGEIKKHLKSLMSALHDEHDMHRSENVKAFRSYQPDDEKEKKEFSMEEHLKELKAEHKEYDAKCFKSLDEFEEKTVAGDMHDDDGDEGNDHTDWVTKELGVHQAKHIKAVTKCAKAMCAAFDDGKEPEEKRWWMKATVSDELAENKERQAKYQKVNAAWDIFDAFICAYLDDSSSVDSFGDLLDEAAALMKNLGDAAAKGLIKSYLESNEKAGAKLSAATKASIAEAHDHIDKGMKVLEKLHGGLGGESEPEPAEKIEHGASYKELQSFLRTRDLARLLAGSLNATLSESRGLLRAYHQGDK